MSVGKAVVGMGAWAWEQFGEQAKPGFLSFLKRKWKDAKEDHEKLRYIDNKWKDFSWGNASERYQKQLRQLYGHIRIIGSTEPVGLDDIFTDVYFLNKPQAFRRYSEKQPSEINDELDKLDQESRMRGLQAIVQERGHHLYILGKPGAGKTTFLKYLIHQTLEANLNKIPIFVTLKDWAGSNLDLLAFISKQFNICQFPDAEPFIEYILENGQAIVLFDGLDEVPLENKQRVQITAALHSFCKQYKENQIIITCRIAATDYSFTEFTYAEMADFSEDQVKVYSRKWFNAQSQKAEKFLVELDKPENRGVKDLGKSPLLLSMICLAYDETLSIPKRRVELYEEALDALLKKWDATRNIQRDEIYKLLSLGRKRQMFARIAAETFENGEIFFSKKQLSQRIETYLKNLPPDGEVIPPDGDTILQDIIAQHGILVERARNIFTFAHLTFQEYFTAKYIADNAHLGTIGKMQKHIGDNRWQEVFLLTASLLDEADIFFSTLQPATNDLFENDKTLLLIQKWVENKVRFLGTSSFTLFRVIYWIIALSMDFSFSLGITLAKQDPIDLDHVLDLAQILEIEHTLDKINFLNLIHSLEFEFERFSVPDFYLLQICRSSRIDELEERLGILLDENEQTALQTTIENKLAGSGNLLTFQLDICITKILFTAWMFAFFAQKIISSHEKLTLLYIKLIQLTKKYQPEFELELNNLSIPPYYSSPKKWIEFIKEFRSICIRHRNIGFSWELTIEQIQKIILYLNANRLLLESIQIAYVTDRKKVSNSILQPTEMKT